MTFGSLGGHLADPGLKNHPQGFQKSSQKLNKNTPKASKITPQGLKNNRIKNNMIESTLNWAGGIREAIRITQNYPLNLNKYSQILKKCSIFASLSHCNPAILQSTQPPILKFSKLGLAECA
jgi:hypothetical protein